MQHEQQIDALSPANRKRGRPARQEKKPPLTATEIAAFEEMRDRLASCFSAIVDVEAVRHGLTRKEHAVLKIWLDGLSIMETAERAHISRGTLQHYLDNIYRKFGVSSRHELSAKLFRRRAA